MKIYFLLKKSLLDNIEIFILNSFGLALGLCVYFLFDKNKEILFVLAGTGISLSFGVLKYKIENDKIFLELFNKFNEKYDIDFNGELSKIINKDTIEEVDRFKIIDYMNLCAEEYLWYTKGRIDKKVWYSWKEGILFYFNSKNINPIVNEELNQKKSYYGLYEELGDKLIT